MTPARLDEIRTSLEALRCGSDHCIYGSSGSGMGAGGCECLDAAFKARAFKGRAHARMVGEWLQECIEELSRLVDPQPSPPEAVHPMGTRSVDVDSDLTVSVDGENRVVKWSSSSKLTRQQVRERIVVAGDRLRDRLYELELLCI